MELGHLILIPIVWIGPVLAPLICSLTMIALSVVLISLSENISDFKIKKIDWVFILVGAFFNIYFVYMGVWGN
jgi:hypothetical protein